MDGQAELAWVAGLNTKMVHPQTVTYPSINWAQHRATVLIEMNALPLSQNPGQNPSGLNSLDIIPQTKS